MKHILIGTAGHVDHGKTALIHALTGIDTDRLKEEKTRGITIDLGFAHMTLGSGEKISIVDVPGHEKFIKNMLAGAGGIDLVLLVVASDDGVMPQTLEHLGILQLLGAKDGIIVLTKCDLTDEDWQDMVCEDIANTVRETFLQDSPLVKVSARTYLGIEDLKKHIAEKVNLTAAKNINTPFRMPVDRVFTAEGYGTVVTGTLIEGVLNQGDLVTVYPSGISGRVRNLQVHNKGADTAYAGQRVAVNLSGLRRDQLYRGDVLAKCDSIKNTRMLDVKLSVLKDSPREVKNGSRLHFYYGTRNVLCKVVLLESDKLLPGESAYAQLRFGNEVSVKRGDTFIVRFYSPTQTVGGGIILSENPKKIRRGKALDAIKSLELMEHGGLSAQIKQTIAGYGIAALEDIKKHFGLDDELWTTEINNLAEQGRITIIGAGFVMEETYRNTLGDKLINVLQEYHKENPLQLGMRKEELRSRVLPEHKPAFFDCVLDVYSRLLQVKDGRVAKKDFSVKYSKEQQTVRDNIMSKLKQGGFTPPGVDELMDEYPKKHQKLARQVVDALQFGEELVLTEPGIIFDADTVLQAKLIFSKLAAANDGTVTLAQFRDKIQASRKFALSLLEYFDNKGFTRKIGDGRVLRSCHQHRETPPGNADFPPLVVSDS